MDKAIAELDFLDTRGLNEELRSEIQGMRRSERLERIADLENRELSALVADLSEYTGLAIADPESFDLDRLNSIPLRILHEFHCVPLKMGKKELIRH